jgi:diguanylate cyclase (GGDEF)-like protein
MGGEEERIRTALSDLENRLYEDSLTGCKSRQYFFDTFKNYAKKDCWLVLLDVKSFTSVNESYTVGVGDKLLRRIAQNLRLARPGSGYVARLVGDKFLIMLHLVAEDELPHVLETFSRAVSRSVVNHEELEISRRARMGVVPLGPSVRPQEAIILANNAKQAAKRESRTFQIYDKTHVVTKRSLPSVDHVRRALQNDEIDYYVQPIFDARTLDVVGYEALIRWIKPSGMVLGPHAFLDSMIECYDDSISPPLHRTRAVAQWAAEQGHFISFNFSAAFLSTIRGLEATWIENIFGSIPYENCMIEMLETIVDSQINTIAETVDQLQRCGVRIAIDDFGIGHSSLMRLRDISVDVVKIDRQFLAGAQQSSRNYSILESMTSLVSALGARSVLEGVETMEDLETARRMNVDMVQGFLLGRPKPTQAYDALLREHGAIVPNFIKKSFPEP